MSATYPISNLPDRHVKVASSLKAEPGQVAPWQADIIRSWEPIAYMRPILETLKGLGFEPKRVLDIGAAHGHFVRLAKDVWPSTWVAAIDANAGDESLLYEAGADEVVIRVLAKHQDGTSFYRSRISPVAGGCSLYREQTDAFSEPNLIVDRVQTMRLDDVIRGQFPLIKLDTQGSELEILQGGLEILKCADVVIAECSFMRYNLGAPLIDEVIRWMQDHEFLIFGTCGPVNGVHIYGPRQNQIDVVFIHRRRSNWLDLPR